MARRPKERPEFYGCVNGHCRNFEQKRPVLLLEFGDTQGSLVQGGWAIPNAYDRRSLFNSLSAALDHSGVTRCLGSTPSRPPSTICQRFGSASRLCESGLANALYLDLTYVAVHRSVGRIVAVPGLLGVVAFLVAAVPDDSSEPEVRPYQLSDLALRVKQGAISSTEDLVHSSHGPRGRRFPVVKKLSVCHRDDEAL